jgi:ABC-type cobalamin/Fe3+-siderophores transport system ATPase subunit
LRALASDCDLLLLDEPTSNLSFENALEVLLYLQNIHEHTNLTTILVSHSPEFSIFVADNIIPLSRKPLRLSEDDKIKIQCKYPRSRPQRWMYDTEFKDQVELLKNKIGIKKNE